MNSTAMENDKRGALPRLLNKIGLSGPYAVWMTGFILIPLLLIIWYGLTDKTGAFTLENILSITASDHAKALCSPWGCHS